MLLAIVSFFNPETMYAMSKLSLVRVSVVLSKNRSRFMVELVTVKISLLTVYLKIIRAYISMPMKTMRLITPPTSDRYSECLL